MKNNKLHKSFTKFTQLFNVEILKLDESDKFIAEYLANAKKNNKFDEVEFQRVFNAWQDQLKFLFPIIKFCINHGKHLEKAIDMHNNNVKGLIDLGILTPIEPQKETNDQQAS